MMFWFWVLLCFVLVLKQDFIMQFRITENLMCSPGWPRTHNPSALEACAIMRGLPNVLEQIKS